ncbi:uncharacterized protein SCODWIG_03297 [Saccharomycodes ludwigii]|uniref:YTH domain-containing protein n=1 Tax=Saccharomycodes ludwigii TaxID=36035 RepID=A0A376BA33_9ASCO|nr:hypothetical protein SCDLUD_003228 [Saccharomycodes ludwigii]KAH3900256.1 hypothetical protein SCDLUD_003228 [Saccharomycodes ludwigii]SSD61536.1 uncharacterized protein SCODWIG_03297 [Saccharomycodes ludwigii]
MYVANETLNCNGDWYHLDNQKTFSRDPISETLKSLDNYLIHANYQKNKNTIQLINNCDTNNETSFQMFSGHNSGNNPKYTINTLTDCKENVSNAQQTNMNLNFNDNNIHYDYYNNHLHRCYYPEISPRTNNLTIEESLFDCANLSRTTTNTSDTTIKSPHIEGLIVPVSSDINDSYHSAYSKNGTTDYLHNKWSLFKTPKQKLKIFGAKCFVIKSFDLADIIASYKHNIWSSTQLGNKRLSKAYQNGKNRVFLFYSVNASGKFCGVAEMKSDLRMCKDDVWSNKNRWPGEFDIEWIYVKDIPNRMFRHLVIKENQGKPVTNSRDTQEVPPDIATSMITIFENYTNNQLTSFLMEYQG